MASTRAEKIARLLERDRVRAEIQGLSLLRASATIWRARVKAGVKPAKAADQAGLSDALLRTALEAHLLGEQRTATLLKSSLALAASWEPRLKRAADKLGLTSSQFDALKDRYGERTEKQADRMVRSLNRSIEIVKSEGELDINAAFDRAGLSRADDFQLRTVVATHVQASYNGGRERALRESDAYDDLWGYEYVAVVDSKTTVLCQDLDGVKRPKDDPFWDSYSPPNHYNCRSSKVEVFSDEDADSLPDDLDDPEDGFDANPADDVEDI